jgi:UDP-4-amino-4,6-dideoxy-N-acetyl-beta-L-altrosamine transaminase
MIPYGRQEINAEDEAAVLATLHSDFLTQGPAGPRFEQAVTSYVGAGHGVAMVNGTAALHAACLALDLRAGDRMWTTPVTFVASANCGRYCGADIDFVDIDPETWNMSVPALREKLERARIEKRLPKIVVAVHFAGQPTDQMEIRALGQEFGFRIIEDAAHSLGANHRGERVGSCRWSDIAVFSFHPVKLITTAEGGMAVTNDDELAWRMRVVRTHGITREQAHFIRADAPAWHYEQLLLGWNYRLSDLHAALGTSQLERLEDWVDRRNVLARNYDRLLADLPLQRQRIRGDNVSAYHLYVVRLRSTGGEQRRVIEAMRSDGIAATVHYPPVHLQPYYRSQGFAPGSFPEAERFGDTAITLPLFPSLRESDQELIVASLTRAINV